MRRWLDYPRVQFVFWSAATTSVAAITLWLLNFEGVVAFYGYSNWIGGLGTIAILIAFICDVWLTRTDGGINSRILVIYGLILLGSLAWMLLNYRISEIYYFPDTWEYLTVARYPIFSSDFFQALRAPAFPLFLKMFGLSSFQGPTPEFLASARLFTQFQSLISFGACAILGQTLAWKVTNRALKPTIFLVVMAFGLNTHISMWGKIVYAESISTSLFFLFIAAYTINDHVSSPRNNVHPAMRLLTFFGLGLIALIFALTRDSNAYLVLFIAIVLIGNLTYSLLFRRSYSGRLVALSAILLAVFSLSSLSAQGGKRWLRPNLNIIHQRILADEDALAFYIERGLPYFENKSIFEMEWDDFGRAVMLSSEGHDILNWVEDNGQRTYYSYLLANPVQSFVLPIINADHLLLPDSREYQLLAYSPPPWISVIDSIVYPTSPFYLGIWTLAVLFGMVFWSVKHGWDDRFSVAVFLLITVYPMMFVIYHGDELEIERHALGLAIQLRLALIILGVVLWDNCLGRSTSNVPAQSIV